MKKDPYITEAKDKYVACGFRVTGISEKKDGLHIRMRDVRKGTAVCPVCGNEVTQQNLSRVRTYREAPMESGMNVFLHVQRQEMHCKCGKHFTRPHSLFPTRHMTADMAEMVKFFKTNPGLTSSDIADVFGVSETYVRSL